MVDRTILALAEAARDIDDLWHSGKQSDTANQMLCDALDAFWLAPRDADRAEVVRLREALRTTEAHLSLLRHRAMHSIPWDTGGLPAAWEVDQVIGKARKALGY